MILESSLKMRSLTTPELFRRGILRGCKSSVSGVEGVAAGVGVAAGADDADAAVPTVLPRAIDNGLESIAGTAASVVVGETVDRFVGAIPSVVGETLDRFVGAIPSVVGETVDRFVGAIPSVVGETVERFVGAIPSVVGETVERFV
ncbi:hypothetical protein, partial [Microcoleus sp. PH2017_05_CCC_O_A]|uniref:hypothetical protein n=1 Tax=Microcoleus sp. PH2017_05_CCC_O_A TaxID=2798816 RepID=UPI0025CEB0DA